VELSCSDVDIFLLFKLFVNLIVMMMMMMLMITTFAWPIVMFVFTALFVFMIFKEWLAEAFTFFDLLRLVMAVFAVAMAVVVIVVTMVMVMSVSVAVTENSELDHIEKEASDGS
jgi:hypothetical protein